MPGSFGTMSDNRQPPAGDLDWGIFPWTLSCLSLLLAPVVLVFGIFAVIPWALVAGSALLLALVLVIVATVRGTRHSELALKALLYVLIQALGVGLLCLI